MDGENIAAAKSVDTADKLSISRFIAAPNTLEISRKPFLFSRADGKLTLNQTDTTLHRKLTVDFTATAIQRRLQTFGKKHPLAKAIGLQKLKHGQPRPKIIDATAGLGRDGFLLACLGCQVHLIERSEVLHALLADGLERAFATSEFAHLRSKIKLTLGDSIALLPNFGTTDERPDVIYLDPMFPERKKSALVKKELQMLQALLGKAEANEEALLAAALAAAKQRVVVKRPKGAADLGGVAPGYAVSSPSMRYDVYLS